MWTFIKLWGLVLLTCGAAHLRAEDQLHMDAQIFQSAQGDSTVLLIDMVHFGPSAYYESLAQELESFVQARSNVAVLLEGVHCRRDTLVLRDHLRRWPFPELADLQNRFAPAELAAVKKGQLSMAIYQYFRETLNRNLTQRGIDYYFAVKPCAQAPMANAAPTQPAPASPTALARATQLQSIDDLYAQTAARVGAESGMPSITQHDSRNPLWMKMMGLAEKGGIRAIVASDIDKSNARLNDLDQLIWLASMSIQEIKPSLVNSAFDYLNGVWYVINQQGFRNQIVIDALKVGRQRGHQHFVLPWGESHNKDLAQRLAQLGYTPLQKTRVHYASCSYVKRIVGHDRCKMGL